MKNVYFSRPPPPLLLSRKQAEKKVSSGNAKFALSTSRANPLHHKLLNERKYKLRYLSWWDQRAPLDGLIQFHKFSQAKQSFSHCGETKLSPITKSWLLSDENVPHPPFNNFSKITFFLMISARIFLGPSNVKLSHTLLMSFLRNFLPPSRLFSA